MEAPGRTFPKALAGAVVLVVAMYVLPLAACLGVMPDALDWQLGFFATVAGNVGGPWLSWALVAAAAVSQVGPAMQTSGQVAFASLCKDVQRHMGECLRFACLCWASRVCTAFNWATVLLPDMLAWL